MSLYTKYRPKDWDSIVGQDLIVKILRSSLKNNNTSHAYIFSGSRWTWKTTSARILAKAFNCTNLKEWNPCQECENCKSAENSSMLDIIEIDAASTTSVENIRNIIENAKFWPTIWKYKIYIIDEVHMLSIWASNALLKTLEEPPEHVKFILATTEIEKVLETIKSRTHRFDFNKISIEDIVRRLKFVCESEKIKFEEKSLELIAKLARWWMRDALTILEQFGNTGEIKESDLRETFSLMDDNFISEIIETLKNQDTKKLTDIIKKIEYEHIGAQDFFDQILFKLRDKMFENLENDSFAKYSKIFEIFRKIYPSIKIISNDSLLIETTLMQATSNKNYQTIDQEQTKVTNKETNIKEKSSNINTEINNKISEKIDDNEEKISKMDDTPKTETKINSEEEKSENIEFNFFKLINELQNNDAKVAATIKNCSFKQDKKTLELFFEKKWYIDRMSEDSYKKPLLESLNKLFGWEWQIILSQSNKTKIDMKVLDDIF